VTGWRRWVRLAAVGAGVLLALEAVSISIGGQVDEVRLALVIALVVCASALLVDAAVAEPARWRSPAYDEPRLGRLDPRTASYVRVIESQLHAGRPDAVLQARLRELVELSLHARHDLELDDPRVEEMLGAELSRVLAGEPRRLTLDEIERCTERIESL
jgi:hypothetical protein